MKCLSCLPIYCMANIDQHTVGSLKEQGYHSGETVPSNKLARGVCMTLEQHLCCQYGRDSMAVPMSCAWQGMPLEQPSQCGCTHGCISTPTGSQVSPSLDKELCPARSFAKSHCLWLVGNLRGQIPPWMWLGNLSPACYKSRNSLVG